MTPEWDIITLPPGWKIAHEIDLDETLVALMVDRTGHNWPKYLNGSGFWQDLENTHAVIEDPRGRCYWDETIYETRKDWVEAAANNCLPGKVRSG